MRIAFRKISTQKGNFEVNIDSLSFSGTFTRDRDDLVVLDSILKGDIQLSCDRCGEEFVKDYVEPLTLKVSEGYYEGDDLDVIESHDHFVDFDMIAKSEIEAIKNEYHYCDKCKDLEGE